MKKYPFILIKFFCVLPFIGCDEQSKNTFMVKNPLNIPRSLETVELKISEINLLDDEEIDNYAVKDIQQDSIIISQLVDTDLDGIYDVVLFQPELNANSEKRFKLVKVESGEKPESIEYCYSRFVPERTDDYAWENNKVGFRTFGPAAQKMVEDGVKGGTLTSGIDAWLKRVEYPIINKWYKKYIKDKNAYHKDTGEGLDNFHVGVSRGVGGIAVKKDNVYHTSKNFTDWKTITTGPIRTSFILEYADWDADGTIISETKHISLDYGSNLSKFQVHISGTDVIHAGLTLHEKDGEIRQLKDLGWISYWEPHEESKLGTTIVVPNGNMVSSELHDTMQKDQSNLFAVIKTIDGVATYYAGFGWKEAGEYTSEVEWNMYLEMFTQKINSPLVVKFD